MIFKSYTNSKKELSLISSRLNIINDLINNLNQEKIAMNILKDNIENEISSIEKNLKELDGIEYKLYYNVVVKGINITRAVDKVAFEEEKDPSTIWKNYYHKVKEQIKLAKD